jgi:predicted RNA-binding protein YlqC (UPF0109 family)
VVFRGHPFSFWASIILLHIDSALSYYSSALTPDNRRGEAMKDLITEIVRALVDQPEEASVNEIGGAHTTVLEVTVAKSGMGKIIGKQGRTAMAIRTILSAASGKLRKRYILEIVD